MNLKRKILIILGLPVIIFIWVVGWILTNAYDS